MFKLNKKRRAFNKIKAFKKPKVLIKSSSGDSGTSSNKSSKGQGKRGFFSGIVQNISGMFKHPKGETEEKQTIEQPPKKETSSTSTLSESTPKPTKEQAEQFETKPQSQADDMLEPAHVYKGKVPEEYLPTEDIYEVDISGEEMEHTLGTELSHKKTISLSEEALSVVMAMKEKDKDKNMDKD